MRYLNVYEMDSRAQAYLDLLGRDSEVLIICAIVAQKETAHKKVEVTASL